MHLFLGTPIGLKEGTKSLGSSQETKEGTKSLGSSQETKEGTKSLGSSQETKINKKISKKTLSKIPPSISDVQINDSFKVNTPLLDIIPKIIKKRTKKSKKEKALFAVTQQFYKTPKKTKNKGNPCEIKKQIVDNGGGDIFIHIHIIIYMYIHINAYIHICIYICIHT
jgi:hypothetical protein